MTGGCDVPKPRSSRFGKNAADPSTADETCEGDAGGVDGPRRGPRELPPQPTVATTSATKIREDCEERMTAESNARVAESAGQLATHATPEHGTYSASAGSASDTLSNAIPASRQKSRRRSVWSRWLRLSRWSSASSS